MNERFTFDLDLVGRGSVAGADEAGRGCLAGPIVAAAVCFDYATFRDADFVALDDLNDSKRLTRERRDDCTSRVLGLARQAVVVCCSPGTIDRRGLHVLQPRARWRAPSRPRAGRRTPRSSTASRCPAARGRTRPWWAATAAPPPWPPPPSSPRSPATAS